MVDYYRKNRVVVEIDEQVADTHADRNPAHQANVQLTNIRLRKVIRKLPDNHQQVIILKYINELSNSEIAAAMGKSEGAIRTLQFRALQELRSMMKNERHNYWNKMSDFTL